MLLFALPAGAAGTRSHFESYGWPVKPFHRPHPVRGSFGDPRTLFAGPPTLRGVLTSGGHFSFHHGIDIAARNGTPVYPVTSGVVVAVTPEYVEVDAGDRLFVYWHLRAQVRRGDSVTAYSTVLGRIARPAGHVHLSELRGTTFVNPLARGHLTPYKDTTRPAVTAIEFRAESSGEALLPALLRGRVIIVAAAEDTPSMRVPGQWSGLPVTPASVSWRVQRPFGRVVIPERNAFDVRATIPSNGDFWRFYARGTYQNMPVLGSHYAWLQRGSYLFNLNHGAFDTRRLRDGVYDIVVTATDIRGNSATKRVRFTVHNAAV